MPQPTATKEHLLYVLQTAKHRLEYLTSNDWVLIVDRAIPKVFQKDEALIRKGKQTNMVYLLVRGHARIEADARTRISQIGPGEICGEMSFLENRLASASVVAEEEVEAYCVEWTSLQSLFDLFPHLASRFYRSLAVNLSRRLRGQIGK